MTAQIAKQEVFSCYIPTPYITQKIIIKTEILSINIVLFFTINSKLARMAYWKGILFEIIRILQAIFSTEMHNRNVFLSQNHFKENRVSFSILSKKLTFEAPAGYTFSF